MTKVLAEPRWLAEMKNKALCQTLTNQNAYLHLFMYTVTVRKRVDIVDEYGGNNEDGSKTLPRLI